MHPTSRRLFLGNVAGAGAGLALPLVTIAQSRQKEADPVLVHVGREMARLYKQQRSGPFFAEHYASLAASLRLMALVFPDIRELARRRPRRPVDDHAEHMKRADEVRKHFGIDISREASLPTISAADEARMRRQLAFEGLAPTLLKMADLAEARGREMARNGKAPQIQRVQEASPWCPYFPVLVTVQELVCLPVWTVIPGGQATWISVCSVAIVTRVVWQWFC
jgi:hypothetical protein